jgi:hypothetical protein
MLMRAFTLAASSAPKITEWISAISTATLGLLGLTFTIWQWKANGFRPRLSARIDAAREAIELKIVNKGRAGGVVEEVLVVHPVGELLAIDREVRFEGFEGGEFRSIALPGFAQMRLIIQAPEDHNFAEHTKLQVGIGRAKDKDVPLTVEPELRLYGLKSVLPPGTKV